MFYLFVFCVNCQFGAVLLVVNGNFKQKYHSNNGFKAKHWTHHLPASESFKKILVPEILAFVSGVVDLYLEVRLAEWVDSIGMWRRMGLGGWRLENWG